MNRSRNIIVLAVAGLMLALSFGSGALAASMITGKQIKNGTITTKDVKNRTLKVKDFSSRTRSKLTGPQGPKGDSGLPGVDGLPGADGLPGLDGVSGYELVSDSQPVSSVLNSTKTYTLDCPAGKTALAGSGGFADPALGDLDGLFSQVSRVDDNTFSIAGLNTSLLSQSLALTVTCATLTDVAP